MIALLIDDHPFVRDGLAVCLEETGYIREMGLAASLYEARHFIENAVTLPSIVILDILLKEEDGLSFLPFLNTFCQEKNLKMPPVLICSVLEDPFRIKTALKLGAMGYISKSSGKHELLNAINTLIKGEIYLSGEHQKILKDFSETYSYFTKRELDVLNLIKQYKTNHDISKMLCINKRTVENHISNIYFKTGATTRQDLMKL